MPPSRPITPATVSDASSDPGSLSDLDSGWTDLSSNRSGGRHSPSPTSDAGDSEDARSVIDGYEGEAWEGLSLEHGNAGGPNPDEDAPSLESLPVPQSASRPAISDPALEDWVADALGTSLLSEDDSLDTSTPHMSIRSHATLRLAFPDPLSNSDDNLLPSRSPSRRHSQSTEAASDIGGDPSTQSRTPSSLTTSFTGTLPSERSFSVPPDDEFKEHGKPVEEHELPLTKSVTSSSASYALSVVLMGHPPLPHLKSMIVSTLMDMVASVLQGIPRIPKTSKLTRIYEVPILVPQSENDAQRHASRTHHILITDRTSGSALSLSSSTFDCPTVALVFIQPPLSSHSLPLLPLNTRYLPLLLPSVSDNFTASLLDLSPSVLFDHSVPNISAPNHASRKSFANQQCVKMNILDNRLDGTQDVLTVDEFTALSATPISTALMDLMLPLQDKSIEFHEKVDVSGTIQGSTELQSGFSVCRKQVVFISAFLAALLFGSAVLLRGTVSLTSTASQSTPTLQTQKDWPFFRPFFNRALPALPTSEPSSSAVPARTRALIPVSLKSLAVSVFRPESTASNVLRNPTSRHSHLDRYKETDGPGWATEATDERPRVLPSIDPAVRPLTLDAPGTKSLSEVHTTQHMSISKVKGKEKASDTVLDVPLSNSLNSLSTRISHVLSPLFDVASRDLRELIEAIDALLHALLRLQGAASQGIGGLVQTLSEQAGQGVQGIASKVYDVAHAVGEKASHRHTRARHKAREIRDVGAQYVSTARQKFEAGFERARGNAQEVINEGLELGRKASRTRRQFREEARKLRRAAREQRTNVRKERLTKRAERKLRGSRCFFQSFLALVA